ncbi:MAG: CPBP family intramembrane metalloprotease [Pirellulales bacterium]|nr:CPBP family intramembrane metalloprotease [Pirellulales bacterium]
MLLETSLGFAGVGLVWWTSVPFFSRLDLTAEVLLRGVLATLPMFVLLGVAGRATWAPLARLRQQVELLVSDLFGDSHWIEIALISLAAGLGEEVFFRGALQPWITTWTNPLFALCAVSLLFGFAHAISTTYLVAATLIGGYFGWLAIAYDDLVAPIIAHALYDFGAIVYIRQRLMRGKR